MMCNVDSKRKEEFLSFYLSFSRKIGKEIFGEFSENSRYQKKVLEKLLETVQLNRLRCWWRTLQFF